MRGDISFEIISNSVSRFFFGWVEDISKIEEVKIGFECVLRGRFDFVDYVDRKLFFIKSEDLKILSGESIDFDYDIFFMFFGDWLFLDFGVLFKDMFDGIFKEIEDVGILRIFVYKFIGDRYLFDGGIERMFNDLNKVFMNISDKGMRILIRLDRICMMVWFGYMSKKRFVMIKFVGSNLKGCFGRIIICFLLVVLVYGMIESCLIIE